MGTPTELGAAFGTAFVSFFFFIVTVFLAIIGIAVDCWPLHAAAICTALVSGLFFYRFVRTDESHE